MIKKHILFTSLTTSALLVLGGSLGAGAAPPDSPTVERISGQDRYQTAVELSEKTFKNPELVKTVFIATGEQYPDSLVAGPAAAKQNAPILLLPHDDVRQEVREEIWRLNPENVVIVGGTNAISADVEHALKLMKRNDNGDMKDMNVSRVFGKDRFETSRAIAGQFFGATPALRQEVKNILVATGANFPDALSASAVAGKTNAPILLVKAHEQKTYDQATLDLFKDFTEQAEIHIVGGLDVVPSGFGDDLTIDNIPYKISRSGGVDRFDTSLLVTNHFAQKDNDQPVPTQTAYLAYGANFPDALAGGAVAGQRDSDLMIIRGNCIPDAIADRLTTEAGVQDVILIGGVDVLDYPVTQFTRCTDLK